MLSMVLECPALLHAHAVPQAGVSVLNLSLHAGTMRAACELLVRLKADILECLVVIELKALGGAAKLEAIPFHSLLQYD